MRFDSIKFKLICPIAYVSTYLNTNTMFCDINHPEMTMYDLYYLHLHQELGQSIILHLD